MDDTVIWNMHVSEEHSHKQDKQDCLEPRTFLYSHHRHQANGSSMVLFLQKTGQAFTCNISNSLAKNMKITVTVEIAGPCYIHMDQ